MKKNLAISLSVVIFAICCMVGINAYAATTITEEDVSLSKTTYTYAAKAIQPAVTVTVDGTELLEGTDYTVEYADNVNAGDASATVTGIGAYDGTVNKSFTIKKCSVKNSKVSISVKNAVVDGSGKVVVKYKGKKLKLNKDFKVSSKSVAKVGANAGSYTIAGKGNYKGSVTVKCNVYPKKVTKIKATSKTRTSVKITWKSQKKYGVKSYKVYKCDIDGKNIKYYKTVNTNSITIDKLDPGEYIYLYVKACVKNAGKNYYGEQSDKFVSCSRPATPTIQRVTCNSAYDSINVTWSKEECTGYDIKVASDKDFKNDVETITVYGKSSTKKRIKLDATQKCYVKVRAFRRYDNSRKTCVGNWSLICTNKYDHTYSSYQTTYYGSSANRCTNIRVASKMINGTILAPGEVFSFDGIVGKRTSDKGFTEAPVFTGNQGHGMALGGGICQVASTMFNASLYGNFEIVERYQHSQRVGYVPLGRDAAMNWGTKNFRFRNNTNYPVKILVTAKDHHLTVKIMTSVNIKHKKVELKVTNSGNKFTLRRYADGKCNYETKSIY